jgi:hypothetical protein
MCADINSEIIAGFLFGNSEIKVVTCCGTSMLPLLKDGESIEIKKPLRTLKRGRVYAFWNGKKILIHRFVWLNKCRKALFIGDNSNIFEQVNRENVLGECVLPRDSRLKENTCCFANLLFYKCRNKSIYKLRKVIIRRLYERKI